MITMMQNVHMKLKSGLPWQKKHSTTSNFFTNKLDLNLRKKLIKIIIWSIALYGTETWTFRKKIKKYLDSFEMWIWKKMEKICWSNRLRNKDVLQRVKEERNTLQTIKR
jgi:hypothetical protein